MKIKELFASEDAWTAYAFALDGENNLVKPLDEKAVKWCLTGAAIKCYGEAQEIVNKIAEAVKPAPITIFNDMYGYVKVKALVEKLDI